MQAKREKIILWTLSIAGVLIIIGFFAIDIMLSRLNLYFDKIHEDMSIVEVRQLLKETYYESSITIEEIEKDGYPIDHLLSTKQGLQAKKYTCVHIHDLQQMRGGCDRIRQRSQIHVK